MNASKAREYFSAYYEGDLEAGLKQQFESALQGDGDLQADYSAFVQTMQALEHYDEAEIEVPADLSEQISRKLDKHLWDQKQTARPGLFGQWRMALLGGMAVVAIGAAFFALNPRDPQSTINTAGMAGQGTVATTTADLVYDDGQIRLVVTNGRKLTLPVVVTDTETGTDVYRGELKGSDLSNPLTNEKAEAAVLAISFGETIEGLTVVLPGASGGKVEPGEGTVVDLAKMVAQGFRTPVLVRVKNLSQTVAWNFAEDLSADQLPSALRDQKAKFTLRNDGFLVLSD